MGARPCSSSMDKTCPSGVPFLCSLSQNTSVHRVPMWVSSVGLHLLGNRRKSSRLRYMGKRSPRASQHCRGHPLSSQRGWPVRTNRVSPRTAPLPVCWTTKTVLEKHSAAPGAPGAALQVTSRAKGLLSPTANAPQHPAGCCTPISQKSWYKVSFKVVLVFRNNNLREGDAV